jgi:hypothetical protein
VSVGPDPNVDINQVEQLRRQINRLAEEVAHLSEMDLAPAEYYGEFLQRVLTALAAPAGAVWIRTPQGNLQLQYQINMRQVNLDQAENSRQMHDELLRQAAMKGQPLLVFPHSSVGQTEQGKVGPGNPTNLVILLAPIMVDKQVAGLVELWQDPSRAPEAQRGFLQFLVRMAGLASGYTRNHQLRQMVGQQQVWTQLEAFSRQIHASLNPTEVAYLVANEGRRLVEADRISIGVRQGRKAHVLAISGADVVEKRSNLVRLMRKLFESVLAWGERLVYSGAKDDTLPPAVLKALDRYLAESNSKLLVVMPLRDEREAESKRAARSIIMMECFEPNAAPEQLTGRLEVVGRHAAPALYNSAEYRKIPMRFLWAPLARLQEGLGGKARTIVTLVGLGLVVLIAAMVFIPYPLKMEAQGQLLPIKRSYVFAPVAGTVKEIKPAASGARVFLNQDIIRMFDLDLNKQINDLQSKILTQEATIRSLGQFISESDKTKVPAELRQKYEEAKIQKFALSRELDALRVRTNANLLRPGEFWIKSPLTGMVLTGDFADNLKERYVKPNEPLLRVGQVEVQNPRISQWELELKIPQKHIGQVLAAFGHADINEELDVDIILKSDPTHTYSAKLQRNKIAKEAVPNRDERNESEPIVLAWAKLSGTGIPETAQVPPEQLLTSTEVTARIRCGNHAMGYSLFYGVWEFIYEKIIFGFF